MKKTNNQPKHEYKGQCIDPLCKLVFSIYLTSWEFKLLDIIECQRCGNDIPASHFRRI